MPTPGSPIAWLLVALGGAMGAMARYGVGLALDPGRVPQAIPYSTLIVNLLGSALLGWLLAQAMMSVPNDKPSQWLLWGVGFCGAFTTMSALSVETITLLLRQQTGLAMLNWGLQTVACLGAAWGGLLLGKR